MNNILNFPYLSILIFSVFVSCTNNSSDNLTSDKGDNEHQSTVNSEDDNSTAQEKQSIEERVAVSSQAPSTKSQEVAEAKKEIEKKYGEQWDFCTCIVKGDSVNNAMLADDIADDIFEVLMTRSDYIDTKCKHLLVQPNATPDEREAHNKKVQDCLRRR